MMGQGVLVTSGQMGRHCDDRRRVPVCASHAIENIRRAGPHMRHAHARFKADPRISSRQREQRVLVLGKDESDAWFPADGIQNGQSRVPGHSEDVLDAGLHQ